MPPRPGGLFVRNAPTTSTQWFHCTGVVRVAPGEQVGCRLSDVGRAVPGLVPRQARCPGRVSPRLLRPSRAPTRGRAAHARRHARRARCSGGIGGRAGAEARAVPGPALGIGRSPRARRSPTALPSAGRRVLDRPRARARLARPAHLLQRFLPRCPGTWLLLASAIGASVAPGGGATFSLVERESAPGFLGTSYPQNLALNRVLP